MGKWLSEYTRSLQEKTERLKSGLAKISCDHLFSKIIPTPIDNGFRSRAKYKIFGSPESFSIRGTDPISGEVPYKDSLWIIPAWGRKLVIQIVKILSDSLTRFWIDGFEIQLSHGRRNAHVTLSVKRQEKISYLELANSMLDKIPTLEGVSIPSKRQDIGKSFLLHTINRVNFFSQYTAFFQSNICLTSRLVEDVKDKCEKVDFYRILDLYCGVGLFSLSMDESSTPIVGVDINKRAIDSARLNAESLGLRDASFVCSPVENFLQNASISPHDLIIVDPPRSGCPESLIRIIAKRKSLFICSVSCSLQTHFRDLKKWIGYGYSVQSITALDMFPFTEFLETVVFLRRKS